MMQINTQITITQHNTTTNAVTKRITPMSLKCGFQTLPSSYTTGCDSVTVIVMVLTVDTVDVLTVNVDVVSIDSVPSFSANNVESVEDEVESVTFIDFVDTIDSVDFVDFVDFVDSVLSGVGAFVGGMEGDEVFHVNHFEVMVIFENVPFPRL